LRQDDDEHKEQATTKVHRKKRLPGALGPHKFGKSGRNELWRKVKPKKKKNAMLGHNVGESLTLRPK